MKKVFLTLFVVVFAICSFGAGILKPSGIILETKPVTATAYTLELSVRSGRLITMDNAAANVLTIPDNATTAIPVDSRLYVQQIGDGVTSVTAAAGVTINGVVAGTINLPNKYAIVILTKIATDEWLLQIQDPYSFTSPLVNTSGVISITQAATAANGYLSSTDWNTFNGKQPADASLTSISGLTYVSDSFIKLTAADTYAVRTIAETKTDLSIDNVTNESKATMFTSPIFTGTVTIPTPFTLGAVSVTPTGTELNYVGGVTSAIQTQIDAKQNSLVSINVQTGTAYTLILSDKGKLVTMDNASANTATIPANASVAFGVGTIIDITQLGAGITTVLGDTGVTVNGVSAGSKAITIQYGNAKLTKIATDTWVVQGDI